MDPIEPILPNPSILPEVRAAQRAAPVRRDGRRDDSPYGRQRRRRPPQQDVEVDVEGIVEPGEADADETVIMPEGTVVMRTADAEGTVIMHELPAPRRVDLTADDATEPPVRRIDLTADGAAEPPARRIDLSA